MKAWIWAAVVVVVGGVAFAIWRWREPASVPPIGMTSGSGSTPEPVRTDPELDPVSADHERRETESLVSIARELALTDVESGAVLASQQELQVARRKLFDDLAAKRITTEQVSKGLHELRARMHERIETAIGSERAKRLRDRMRDDHR
jgi:hypothetical protein